VGDMRHPGINQALQSKRYQEFICGSQAVRDMRHPGINQALQSIRYQEIICGSQAVRDMRHPGINHALQGDLKGLGHLINSTFCEMDA
jgi:hypothetical protein